MYLRILKDIMEDNDLLQKQVAITYKLAEFYTTSVDYLSGLTERNMS